MSACIPLRRESRLYFLIQAVNLTTTYTERTVVCNHTVGDAHFHLPEIIYDKPEPFNLLVPRTGVEPVRAFTLTTF